MRRERGAVNGLLLVSGFLALLAWQNLPPSWQQVSWDLSVVETEIPDRSEAMNEIVLLLGRDPSAFRERVQGDMDLECRVSETMLSGGEFDALLRKAWFEPDAAHAAGLFRLDENQIAALLQVIEKGNLEVGDAALAGLCANGEGRKRAALFLATVLPDRVQTPVGVEALALIYQERAGGDGSLSRVLEWALQRALEHPDDEVRRAAVQGLSGDPDRNFKVLAEQYDRESDGLIRREIVWALRESRDFLQQAAAADGDPSVRCAAVETLKGRLRYEDRGWLEVLRESEEDQRVREALEGAVEQLDAI